MNVIEKHVARSGQHGERKIIKERSCFTTAFAIKSKKQNTTGGNISARWKQREKKQTGRRHILEL